MNEKITFTLDIQMANVILAALHEAPYKMAAPVIQELQKQVADQQKDGE